MKKYLPLYFLLKVTFLVAQENSISSEPIRPLEDFVGYYNVGTKPGKPFFKSRWFLRGGNLYTVFDSDKNRQFNPFENNQWKSTIVFKEDQLPEIHESDTNYYMILHFDNDKLQSFKIRRPRSVWQTDLYGYRMPEWDTLALDTEMELNDSLISEKIKLYFSRDISEEMKVINGELKFELTQLIKDFNISTLPQIVVRVYPDQSTYHNAVLTPYAPTWQMGRIWHKNEIRMMAPGKIDLPDGVSVSEIYLHEIIHAIQWNRFSNPNDMPKWLWEGVASFKGCCAWTTLKDISSQFPGKLPGIKQINRNPELNYDFGYYLVQFIQEKWGWDQILELMREQGNIQKVLNISNRQFHSEFEKWIEDQK